MKKAVKYKVIFFLAALGCLVFFTGAARAAETDTISIVPAFPDSAVKNSDAWFLYNLDRNQSRKDAVEVINNKNETVVVKLYAVDATTTADGSFALLQESDPRLGVGSWIKLAANDLELQPRSAKLVPFVITIPQNADAGDQMGGIVVEEVGTNGPRVTGTEVRIITRVGVRIYERVPGELTSGYTLSTFNWKPLQGQPNFWLDLLGLGGQTEFFTNIKNDGNIRLSPVLSVEIKNMFGRTVGRASSPDGETVFPRSERAEIRTVWNRRPLFGRYQINMTANFSAPGAETATRTLTIWAFPFRLLFLLIILFAVFAISELLLRYFRKAHKNRCPIYRVKFGDSLDSLEKKFKAHWKKIARLNNIKKPFVLVADREIFIPLTGKNKKLLGEMIERGELARSAAVKTRGAKMIISTLGLGAIIIVIAGGYGYLQWRRYRVIQREIQVPAKPAENMNETDSMTAGGAIRPSSIKVAILSPAEGDAQSTERIVKKFQLIGYNVSASNSNPTGDDFSATTVLYAPGKLEEADMVKNDLGVAPDIGLKEKENLPYDIMVYNLLPKDNFFEIGTVFTAPQNQ